MRPSKGQTTGLGVEGRSKRVGLASAALAALSVLLPLPTYAQTVAAPADLTVLSTCIAAGAVALAIAVGLWALAEQNAAARLRRNIRESGARARAAVGERDALISAGREALVVWGRDGSGPFAYRGADVMLDSCLAGSEATSLSQALDELGANGAPFALTVREKGGRKIAARGRAVGGMAAVWLEEEKVNAQKADFEAILDALPVPVWLRDRTLSLLWGNQAFLSAAGENDVETALAHQAALDKSERDLAAAARAPTADGFVEALCGGGRASARAHLHPCAA